MVYSESESKKLEQKLQKIIALKGEARECLSELSQLHDSVLTPEVLEQDKETDGTPKVDVDGKPILVVKDPAVIQKPQFLGNDMVDVNRDKRYDYWKAKGEDTLAKLASI